jgi:hypothetical protein
MREVISEIQSALTPTPSPQGRAIAYGNIGDGEAPPYPPLEGPPGVGKKAPVAAGFIICDSPARKGEGSGVRVYG